MGLCRIRWPSPHAAVEILVEESKSGAKNNISNSGLNVEVECFMPIYTYIQAS